MPEIPTRLGNEDDLSYVVDCWVHHMVRISPGERPAREWKKWAIRAVSGDQMTVRVACAPDDEDAIIGFAVLEVARGPVPPCVHFVYVRDKARRCGVATELLRDVLSQAKVEYTGTPLERNLPIPKGWRINAMRSPS